MANNACMTLILLHLLAESLPYLDILCDHEKSSKIMHCIAISHDLGSYIFDTFNSYALHASYIHASYIQLGLGVGPGCFAVLVGGLSNPIEP